MNDTMNSSLASYVHIQQAAIRAIRLENDLHYSGITQGYVLTSQAMVCLGRILSGLGSKSTARAWTLTGPYGSGKSYFGLFLSNLLGADQVEHRVALDTLEAIDPDIAGDVHNRLIGDTRGFFPILVTGYRTSLQDCLQNGIARAVQELEKQGIPASDLIGDFSDQQVPTSRTFLKALSRLLQITVEYGYQGILLIVDELGKLLEYAAAHPEEADIYLLQEIAEFANRSGDTPLVVIGVLHQAFERYATFLNSLTQQEWSKIQGRFEDIPFQEPPVQQLYLLSRALVYQNGAITELKPLLQDHVQRAIAGGWCPPMMPPQAFVDLSLETYPLHPTTLVALPLIFRRLAQNERSVFAYLTSNEPNGFQEFLERHQAPAFVSLADLFDYVAANFQGRLYASGRGRVLAETIDRLNSTALLSPLDSALIKTVGLLTWLGETSHLQATEDALMAALHGTEFHEDNIRAALGTLRQRSLLVYRRFNRSYAIWQGSDVDIEDRLQQAHQHLSKVFSPADMLSKYMPPRPLVARRHSYQTGTMRFFDVRYMDIHTDRQAILAPSEQATGLVLLCLPLTPVEEHDFIDWADNILAEQYHNIVVGVARPALRLIELLHELRALQWVYEHTPELRDDTVARQEWRARVDAVEAVVRQHLDETFGSQQLTAAGVCRWYHNGHEITAAAMGRNLTSFLSEVCDNLYHATPRVWNELLNRRVLSSQAAAARRNLIDGMLTRSSLAVLGIEKFPPERSMYESLLNAGGLHKSNEADEWYFSEPTAEDPLRLRPVWKAIDDYIFGTTMSVQPLEALYQVLKSPPYGITDGVLPVLLCAFYLVHQDEMTLYREGTLLPEPTVADWEVLLRRPDLFAVAGCRLIGPRRAVLKRFAQSLGVDEAMMPVVRELIRRMKTLPEHTWRTQRLADPALRVREAIERARSPEQLLFSDLPSALDLSPFTDKQTRETAVTRFFDRLNNALQELSEATPQLRTWARDELLTACGLATGEEGWGQFLALATVMVEHVTHPKLSPMLQRATHAADPDFALESVLAFVASRPLRTWTDGDADRFPGQARAIGQAFQEEHLVHFGEEMLTPEQQARTQDVANGLQTFLKSYYNNDDRQVVLAALRRILREK